MKEDLKLFLQSKAKETQLGGYTFIMENFNFTVIEMPLGISLQFYLISDRKVTEPTEAILDKNITLQEFSQKLVEIIESNKDM